MMLLQVLLLGLFVLLLLLLFYLRKRRQKRTRSVTLVRASVLQQNAMVFLDQYRPDVAESFRVYHDTYVAGLLARPHTQLGRPGVVCPFIPTSIKKDAVYYGAIDAVTIEEAAQVMLSQADSFASLAPENSSKDAVYKTAIYFFPLVPTNRSLEFVDNLQKLLKPIFVAQGLMIGAFHPESRFPGLHNASFFPRAAPFASVDIRLMIPEDLKFLTPSTLVASKRHTLIEAKDMLTAYISRFEPSSRVLAPAYGLLRDLIAN